MGSGPALALLLLAAICTLHCCSPAAAADGGAPTLGAAGITFGQSARRLLEVFDATAGTLSCDSSTYVAPLTISTPGLYRFRVKALGTNTNSATITSGVVLVGKPSVPTSVTYTGGVGKVTVLWQLPATDPDPTTTKYRLYATPSSGGTRRLLEEAQTSFLELTPTSGSGSQPSPYNATAYLPAGNYTFQLSAWNAVGESALSNPSAVIDVAFSTSPRFWSVQGSSSGATLNVIRPDSVAEPDNMLYKVAILQAGDSGSGTFRAATLETYTGTGSLANPAVFTIPLSAFGQGVAYAQARFVVIATNASGGFEAPSAESPIVTVGVPPAPPSLTFTTTSLDRATVSWAKAATATRYRVELKQTGTGNSAVVSTAAVDGSGDGPFSQTFDNLTPGSYAVSVHSVNANGDDSATAASSTSDVVVGAPLSPTITAVTGSVGQLTVQWSAPAINADLGVTYKLNIQDVTTGREPADETLVTLAAGAGSQTISGLPAGTKRVWITATNANAGDGSAVVAAWAGAVQVGLSTAPGIASSDGVVGSALGATIALTAPSAVSTTGGKLNKFLIEAYHATEDRELGRPVQVDASPADSAGPWTVFWAQTAPQLLRFKVAAQSDDRTVTSPWSGFTDAVAVGKPASPELVSSAGGVNQLSLSWGSVDTATSYMVLIYRNGDTEPTYTRTVSGTTHTERGPGDAGLQWGMYTVKVAAVSANGASSDPAKAGPLTVGKPSKPAAAPTATGGIGNLTLDWQKPAEDPDPANTVFYAKVYNAAGTSLVTGPISLAGATGAGTSESPFAKTIALAYGEYTVTVFGRNVNGDGDESDKSSATKVELSNAPAIIGAAGFNERVELKVLRPDTLASVAALSYKVQLYSALDEALPGDPLDPHSTTGTGTIYNPAVLTLLGSQLPQVPGQYKFEVVAVGGPTNVTSLTLSDLVTVGVPETPTIDTSSGGLSSATITWSASPTTAYYMVELLDKGVVKKSARVKSSETLSYTFNNVAAGTYTLRLTAVNSNNPDATPVSGTPATTGDVVVGVPGQPRLTAATGSVGRATITWLTAISDPNPASTTYWLRTYLVNSADGSWTEQGVAAEAGASPVTRILPAGVYRFAMFAKNTNGDGPASDLTDPITVGFANEVTAVSAVGTRDQATITFTAPSQLSTAQVAKFRVQAIREDSLVVEAGRELTLDSEAAAGATGLQLAFTPSSGNPQRLKFRLAATDGTFAGDWSAESNVVTIGQPAAPSIRSFDGQLNAATVIFDAVPLTTSYGLRLLRCTGTTAATCTVEAGTKPSEASAGQHTFSPIATPGLYAIEVTATAASGVASNPSLTPILLVGKPGAPAAAPTVVPGVGNATVSWEAPAVNPDATGVVDATSYTLRVYTRDGSTLVSTQELSGLGGQGTTESPFTKLVTLVAGTWKATVAASNKHGEGPESALSAEFTVGVTTKPTINSVQGGPAGLTLEVYRPSDISGLDARYLTYLVQLYDADTGATLGNEMRVTSNTGDGTVAGGAFSFQVPFAKPQRLTAEVIADAGATRSPPSDRTNLVVVGTPEKPVITSATGSPSAAAPFEANVTLPKVYTAESYTIDLADFNVPANSYSYTLTPEANAAGPFTHSQTVTTKGTYQFKVVASNVHKTTSLAAVSQQVVVGLPDAPTLPADAVTAAVGKITLKWTAPQTNDFIGTQYTALLYRPTNLTAPIFSFELAASGTAASGTTSFSEDVALPAGPYRLEIATANVHGSGDKSAMTAAFTVGISSTPAISTASGDTSGAELKVLRPDTMADDAVATYLIQAYTDAEGSTKFGEEVRGNNTASNADGKTPASAFVFPYPYTGAAKLWFTVTVVVGGTRSSASPIYGPVIMGTPATPRLISPLGGAAQATFTCTAVPTAVKYIVTASKDGSEQTWTRTVTDTSAQQAWSLADHLGGEPGLFTFAVVAENENKATSEAATTGPLIVGLPGEPRWSSANPVVAAAGTATLSWTAPAYNAKIGTGYYAQLWRDDGATKFGGLVALTPTGKGTAEEPFTATIPVTAGSWSYQLLTNNTWGAGGVSAKTQAVQQAVADTPTIKDLTGGITTATLRFLKPANASNQDTITYRAQLYDASTSPATKLGDPVVLNVTSGDGTDGEPYVASLGPFSQARMIAVAIQATGGAGGFSTALSAPSGAVVVGTPAKPTISQALGSNGLSATVKFAKSFTATSYTILLVDVTNPTNNKSEVLSPQEGDNGPWEHTLTAPAKATYRFEITATNVHNAISEKAVSEDVVVGLPDAPALGAITPDVGKATISWSAAATNAAIGTRYTAVLYRPQNPSAPYLNLTLEAKGTTSFTEDVALPAGPYLLEIATENEHGAGGKSARTEQAFTVGVSSSPTIVGLTGDASGATLDVMRPGNMSDDAVATYLIQAYRDAEGSTKVGSEVRGNNTKAGADGQNTAFVFPYPHTAAAKLWFKVAVVMGGTRSPASNTTGPVVVGTPAAPRLASPLGGKDAATFTFTAVPTATEYIVTASKDGSEQTWTRSVTEAGPQTWSLAQLGGEPGQFTFSVVAENANGESQDATTPPLIVGTPSAPAWAASNPVTVAYGTTKLSWTAPAYNAKIGTRYYAQLWRDNGATKFGGLVALAPTLAGEGTTQDPFTATINTTAGSWSYQLLTNNTWGVGGVSDKTEPLGQPLADEPTIQSVTGGASTATLRFIKPQSATDQDTITYRAQLYNASVDPAEELGAPVALKINSGAGTAGSPYVATLGPFSHPLSLEVAVQAIGGAGSVPTALSNRSSAVVVGLPLVPQIEGLEGSKTELRLKWLKNDTTATSYRIAVFKAGQFVSPVVEVPLASLGSAAGTPDSPYSFAIPAANLPDANRYAVKVAGVNANGAGPWSALSEVAVYGVPAAPGTPAVTLIDPTVRLVFTKSDTTAVKYSAFIKPTTGAEVEVPLAVRPVTGSTTQLFAVVGPDPPELPQGGTYTLQVAAYNANDDLGTRSAASAQFQLGTVAPSVPLAVTATSPTPLAASLAFQAPASSGGSPITSYDVEQFHDGESKGVKPYLASALYRASVTEGTAARPFRVSLTNLAPGSWTFVVTAVNKNGRTDAPATVAITVRDVPPTKPAIAAISGADSTLVNGVITQTINLSVLKPTAGGNVTGWAVSLWNSAKTAAFIRNAPFTPSDGDGTITDPHTAVLTIANIPDGVYTVTVTATTATGSATSNWSPPVVLGTPPAPTVTGVTSTPQSMTLRVTTPQTVTVGARSARSLGGTITGGVTTASQPALFTVTLNPTLGANLKPITRRVKASSGTGTAAKPYTLVVPVTLRSEWTVQAVTGSNVNGASDADDWPTPVATGVPDPASALSVVGTRGSANITFTSAPAWTTGATVHVKVINAVTLQDQAFAGARGVLPFTVNATAYPYVVPAGGANQWSAIIRNANNQVGTAGSPIPHVGSWRFQIAVINRAGGESAFSALTPAVDVGAPAQVVAPTIAQSTVAGLVMNVNIREALVISTITNPPAVTQYRVRLYRGPATNSTLVKTVTFTPEQATTVQAINLATLNLPAGTYSAAIQPVGVNGAGPESARSAYIAMQFRRAAARTVRTGRRLVEAQEADAQDSSADNQAGAKDGAPLKRHRNRHLL